MSCECNGKIVQILFIRHGFSCANALKHFYPVSGLFARVTQGEPPLTLKGVKDTIRARDSIPEEFKNPDIVLSSVLIRAMQTAHFLYPDKNVYVAPYIREIDFGNSNRARPPTEQTNEIAMQNYYLMKRGIIPYEERKFRPNYRFVVRSSGYGMKWEDAQEINYDKFIFWIEKSLPELLRMEKSDVINKNKIVIAVVGHSSFMQKYIHSVKHDKPDNVGMVELNFCYKRYKEIYKGEYIYRYSLRKLKCENCKHIHSLRKVDVSKKPGCDGVIFHGFQVPDKKLFLQQKGDSNCNF